MICCESLSELKFTAVNRTFPIKALIREFYCMNNLYTSYCMRVCMLYILEFRMESFGRTQHSNALSTPACHTSKIYDRKKM